MRLQGTAGTPKLAQGSKFQFHQVRLQAYTVTYRVDSPYNFNSIRCDYRLGGRSLRYPGADGVFQFHQVRLQVPKNRRHCPAKCHFNSIRCDYRQPSQSRQGLPQLISIPSGAITGGIHPGRRAPEPISIPSGAITGKVTRAINATPFLFQFHQVRLQGPQ